MFVAKHGCMDTLILIRKDVLPISNDQGKMKIRQMLCIVTILVNAGEHGVWMFVPRQESARKVFKNVCESSAFFIRNVAKGIHMFYDTWPCLCSFALSKTLSGHQCNCAVRVGSLVGQSGSCRIQKMICGDTKSFCSGGGTVFWSTKINIYF